MLEMGTDDELTIRIDDAIADLLSKQTSSGGFGLWGSTGFMLMGPAATAGVLTLFLFQMVFMDASATIATGALAERWKFRAFVLYAILGLLGGLLYARIPQRPPVRPCTF